MRAPAAGRLLGAAIAGALLMLPFAPEASARPIQRDIKKRVDPLKIERHEELRFGKLVVLGSSGTITVPVQGLASYQGAVRIGGTIGPARLTFTGEPNRTIEVTVIAPIQSELSPTGDVRLDSLSVEPIVALGVNKFPNAIRLRLDSSGQNGILIGGSLSVTPNGSTGVTTVPIPVTAVYTDAN